MYLRELDANLIVILDALLLDASVTKAAERLGRSPSAVSHALARLREIFDDPLFVRAGQHLVRTSRAEQLAPTVHIIVSSMEGLLRSHNSFDPLEQKRTFLVACQEFTELTLLSRVRQALAREAPGIVVERQDVHSATLIQDLREGRSHLAITFDEVFSGVGDLSSTRLADDEVVALALPEHALAGSSIALAGLFREDEQLIIGGMQVEQAVKSQPELANVTDLEHVEYTSSPLIAAHLAIERNAVVLVPRSVAELTLKHTRLQRIELNERLSGPIYLVWHVSQERDECHAWLRQRLGEMARTGAAEGLPPSQGDEQHPQG